MSAVDAPVAIAGAGRMGRGIAVALALAGQRSVLLDLKPREPEQYRRLAADASAEIRATLLTLAEVGMLSAEAAEAAAALSVCAGRADSDAALAGAGLIFEAVAETLDAKRDAFGFIDARCGADTIIASTTSTMLSDELQTLVSAPARFINAHWLNPAFLIPLVELSPASGTAPETTRRLKDRLEAVGKIPVVCKASPGYIVPRIQMLAMNEAARLLEEGVASAEDIDKATRYGFGFRFAVLGLLEFIDWGGGDILYHAGNYMTAATGERRFEAPDVVKQNMRDGRIGLRTGKGFLDYDGMDVDAYRRRRLAAFVALLKHFELTPALRTGTGGGPARV